MPANIREPRAERNEVKPTTGVEPVTLAYEASAFPTKLYRRSELDPTIVPTAFAGEAFVLSPTAFSHRTITMAFGLVLMVLAHKTP